MLLDLSRDGNDCYIREAWELKRIFGVKVLIKYEEINSKLEVTSYDPNTTKDFEAKEALRLIKERRLFSEDC